MWKLRYLVYQIFCFIKTKEMSSFWYAVCCVPLYFDGGVGSDERHLYLQAILMETI